MIHDKRLIWELRVMGVLVSISLALYSLNFLLFRDMHHILFWSLTSISFLPISALIITLLINRILTARDKALRFDKLNMLIGLFFSDMGNDLLVFFSNADPDALFLSTNFGSPEPWSALQRREVPGILRKHEFKVPGSRKKLAELKAHLLPHKNILMRLMENPNLLEHEQFTQLLRAAFHLLEELAYRENLEMTSDADVRHLCGDMQRTYGLLVREWVLYMIHLQQNFPFLFSLAVRTNPLDRSAAVMIPEDGLSGAAVSGADAA